MFNHQRKESGIIRTFLLNLRVRLCFKTFYLWTEFIFVTIGPLLIFLWFFTLQITGNKTKVLFSLSNSPLKCYFFCILFMALILVILNHIHNFKPKMWTNFTHWIRLIQRPLLLGALVGIILDIIYLSFTATRDTTNLEIDTILVNVLGLYLTCTGLFIAFWGIYGEKHPIMDLMKLMECLKKDLDNCKRKFIWAFPGLSFGSLSGNRILYEELYKSLNNVHNDSKIMRRLYVLNEKEIFNFYNGYLKRLNKATDGDYKYTKQDIGRAICDSIYLMRNFVIRDRDSIFYVKSEFRYQIIIIDDITYFLNTFGLPIKTAEEENYKAPESGDNTPIVVEVVATRIQNRALAIYLEKEIGEANKFKTFQDEIEGRPEIYNEIKDKFDFECKKLK